METTKTRNPGEIITKEEYLVKTPEGETFIYTMILEASGAFSYGNQTCMTLKCREENGIKYTDQYYDTRYCKFASDGKGFREWSAGWIEDYCRPGCSIERITD